jgi:hypothetical protein
MGMAALAVRLDDQRIELGEIEIAGTAGLFERPMPGVETDVLFGDAIRLIGFDPPATLVASQPIPLTLYWESLSGEIAAGYTVFTHLIAADGRLIAQHDSPPANGQRPTNEWLAGEFIADPHELVWREPDYRGPAAIMVGLYDPATGARLPIGGGADGYSLPLSFEVVDAEQ